jgi:hypothetical protein
MAKTQQDILFSSKDRSGLVFIEWNTNKFTEVGPSLSSNTGTREGISGQFSLVSYLKSPVTVSSVTLLELHPGTDNWEDISNSDDIKLVKWWLEESTFLFVARRFKKTGRFPPPLRLEITGKIPQTDTPFTIQTPKFSVRYVRYLDRTVPRKPWTPKSATSPILNGGGGEDFLDDETLDILTNSDSSPLGYGGLHSFETLQQHSIPMVPLVAGAPSISPSSERLQKKRKKAEQIEADIRRKTESYHKKLRALLEKKISLEREIEELCRKGTHA